MVKLIVVLGDQLSLDISSLNAADRSTDVVMISEVMAEATYVKHHPKKIALIFSAMRHFTQDLKARGWTVTYTKLDDPENAGSLAGEILRRSAEFGTSEVIVTEPGEWRVINELTKVPVKVTQLQDSRFIASHAEFEDWAKGRKKLRVEYFYRDMRRKTGLLMDGNKPVEGKWNFDHDNRKRAQPDLLRARPLQFEPDVMTQEVLTLIEGKFPNHFGDLRPFWFATSRKQALRAMQHFMQSNLPSFGATQDAMLQDDPFLNHAFLSVYINCGLLSPLEVCQAAEQEYWDGRAPINSVEGFIRPIIGWREYVRGIYFLQGREYPTKNALDHTRALPNMYWGAETKMNCMTQSIGQTASQGYAHHIQRLMVTGNFALLAGIDPYQVHEWYLSVYVEAYEWVEVPNTIGMSQFADGGVVASKPYVSSGAYIDRMSDYCKSCSYSVKAKTGERACPFNLLYWRFLVGYRDTFSNNPRMGQMYRTWDKMAQDHKERVLSDANTLLKNLDNKQLI